MEKVPSTITLFIPCLMDAFYPSMGRDLVSLLKRLGFRVEYPLEQTCCGQPAYNQGFFPQARSLARRFLTVFQSAERIVCPSGSCTAMVQKHYPELFSAEPNWQARALEMATRIFEASQFLVEFAPLERFEAFFPYKVTYHDSCHSHRGLGIYQQPRKLLSRVKGLTLIEMESSSKCCGFGGMFSQKFPELSEAIVREKTDRIEETGADWVVGNDPGCLMHIQSQLKKSKSPVGVKHLVEILNSHESG